MSADEHATALARYDTVAPPSARSIADQYPLAPLVALLDLALVLAAAFLAHKLRYDHWNMSMQTLASSLGLGFCAVIVQAISGTYASWRGRSFAKRLLNLYTAWAVAIGIVLAFAFAIKASEVYSRLWLGYTVGLSLVFLTTMRVLVAITQRKARAKGQNLKNVLLVFSGDQQHSLKTRLKSLKDSGYNAVSTLTLPPNDPDGPQRIAEHTAEMNKVHEIWLCLSLAEGSLIRPIMHALRHQTVNIRYFPDTRGMPLLNHKIDNIAGQCAINISCSPMDETGHFLKRAEDILIGGLITLLILPVCALIAIAVKITSRGPVIFKQARTGMHGEEFHVYKFRSMAVHKEKGSTVTQAQYGDPRVTRLGAFLRRTSLDELPQFFNVLRGDMSIVGPRPHALAHNEYYKDQIEFYMKRHKVKPGITGWAQVNGLRGVTDTLDKMQRRVECDLWYINNWSLMLDLRIIALTVIKGFINRQP